MKNYKYISFFSGAMGLDLGLEEAGWETELVLDNYKAAIDTIRINKNQLHNPQLEIIHDDIRNYTASEILERSNIPKDELFAVVGGPPCQAFSSAGKRLGLDDERGNVSLKYIEFINELKPKYFVMENVRGMLSMPFGKGISTLMECSVPDELLFSRNGLMLMLIDQFNKMGYQISFALYNAANYGIPQKRERVIIIGRYGDKKVPLMIPTHHEDGNPKWLDLKSAIGGMDTTKMHYNGYSPKRIKYYNQLNAGENWRNLTDDVQKEAMGNSYHLGGGKTGFYRRLAWDKPSPTIVTSPSMPATDLCHPDEIRPLSIEEYAAIQQFPPKWEFSGKMSDIYKQIGNAVPVGLGKVIGEHIIAFEKGELDIDIMEEKNTRFSRYHNTTHHFYENLQSKLEQIEYPTS